MWLKFVIIFCVIGATFEGHLNILQTINPPAKCPFSISSYLTAISIQDESLQRNGLFKDILDRYSPIIMCVSKMNTNVFKRFHTLIIEIRNYTQLVRFNDIFPLYSVNSDGFKSELTHFSFPLSLECEFHHPELL